MQSTQITFDLPDSEAEMAFLREYMVPAWDRFRDSDAFESGWFWPAGEFATHDTPELSRETHDLERLQQGQIVFVVNGDPDRIIEREQDRWEQYKDEGLLDGWETRSFQPEYRNVREKMHEKYGQAGGDRAYRLRSIAADFTIECLAATDSRLPAVGESTDADPVPVGFWVMIHYLMKQQGYDWYSEIDACTKSIENRLRSLATFHGEAAAQEELDAVIDRLESVELDVE